MYKVKYRHTHVDTHTWRCSGRGGIRKLLHYHRMVSFFNNAYFWHVSSSLKKEKHLLSKCFFSSLQARVQGAQSFTKPERLGQAEEAVLTAWVYSWKKRTMWVLFTHWLWKQVSREQSCLSPAALRGFSGLSSGFIKLLCKGTHQGRLSRKAVAAWLSSLQQLQLGKSELLTMCISMCEYMCEDCGAGLVEGPGQKAQTGSLGRNTWWELHTMVLGVWSLR